MNVGDKQVNLVTNLVGIIIVIVGIILKPYRLKWMSHTDGLNHILFELTSTLHNIIFGRNCSVAFKLVLYHRRTFEVMIIIAQSKAVSYSNILYFLYARVYNIHKLKDNQ